MIFSSCKSAKVETQTEKQKSEIIVSEFPKQIGFVNDFENIFTEEEIKSLEKLLIYYKDTSNRQVVVITINTVPKNVQFEQYAIRMSDNWNIGRENNENGLTVVMSKSLKKIRISTTEKTRYYLTDEFCKKVIDENMIPEFKNGEYYDGLLLGLNELIRKWI